MGTYQIDDLEICIATMNREDISFLKPMFNIEADEIPYHLLIVNQSKTKTLGSNYPNIRVINDVNFGLSRSRNIAIENSRKSIVWFLDDDCKVLNNAVNRIIEAHNSYIEPIISFMTIGDTSGLPFSNYPKKNVILSSKQLKYVLSPEITFKKEVLKNSNVRYDIRFGLGAQFQDSENHIFLKEALKEDLFVRFCNQFIVKHDDHTSSDEVSSNRLIYARGALAVHLDICTASLKNIKYVFFLWRKGYVRGWSNLFEKYLVFNHGMNDYLNGFEGHRNSHPDNI